MHTQQTGSLSLSLSLSLNGSPLCVNQDPCRFLYIIPQPLTVYNLPTPCSIALSEDYGVRVRYYMANASGSIDITDTHRIMCQCWP